MYEVKYLGGRSRHRVDHGGISLLVVEQVILRQRMLISTKWQTVLSILLWNWLVLNEWKRNDRDSYKKENNDHSPDKTNRKTVQSDGLLSLIT